MTPVDVVPFIAVLVCIQAISVMIRQNRYIREFKQASAVSPEASTPLAELDLSETRIFKILARQGVIREGAQDRWFLDQQRATALRQRRFMIALPSIALGTAGVGLVWMLVR